MKTRLPIVLLVTFSVAACARAAAHRPEPAAAWLTFGLLQETPDTLGQLRSVLRDDGTYASVSTRRSRDVVTVQNSVGVIPDSAMHTMRAMAELAEVKAYRGCGSVDGPEPLFELQIQRWSFTQRILFTDTCLRTAPAPVAQLLRALKRGLAGVPPFQ